MPAGEAVTSAVAVDPLAFAAIVGMALATYATRAGGFWMMRWLPMSRGVEAWLRHIPGAVIVALLAPMIARGGVPEIVGTAVAAAVMRLARHDLVAIVAGIATVAALRRLA
ncbi:MAG: AzlD domain-containing protein [Alphaproteobacteria bacterium]|nr:AzlD domain-containing protein [Alphaproteobacteria bacterium]